MRDGSMKVYEQGHLSYPYDENFLSDGDVREWYKNLKMDELMFTINYASVRWTSTSLSSLNSWMVSISTLKWMRYIWRALLKWITNLRTKSSKPIKGPSKQLSNTPHMTGNVMFFSQGVEKLVFRYQKCSNLHGNYIEKYQWLYVTFSNKWIWFYSCFL